jgi:5-formyltetrahydrofolate cyclo-ligase
MHPPTDAAFGRELVASHAMTAPLDQDKARLRQQVRGRLQSLPSSHRAKGSAQLLVRLQELPVWSSAKSVLLFAPLPDEPDIWPLLAQGIAAGKTVALPAFVPGTNNYTARHITDPSRDLIAGKFGIREPADKCPEVQLNRLDLVLVPGVAFDTRGGRLGRGKGYYDRLLSAVNGTKCGVAFDEQIVDAVPVGPMDVRLNCILTPTRWIET